MSKPTSNITARIFSLLLSLLLAASVLPGQAARPSGTPAGRAASAACELLPAPTGRIVNVSTVEQLQSAVNTATPGDTILAADGHYDLHGVYLWLDTPHVALRSASGHREAVILDGNYETTEIVTVAASDVTIADLTIQRAQTHPIHVVSTDSADTLNTLVYNVHIIDPGQQAIKINPNSARTHFPDNGVIACSRIELTDAGRPHIWDINGSCYTGGVDAHGARGWVVRDNVIEGFWCEQGLSEHAVHFWRGCRDTLVERNLLRNNARGVGFGLATSGDARTYSDNPCPSAGGGYVDHYGGIIRNNFVFANRSELFSSQDGFDCGLCLWQACGAEVLHNTVASTQAPFSSIEWRFPNTLADITNNLVSHNLRQRDGASAALSGNLDYQPLSSFVNGASGDLHLSAAAVLAIDQVPPLADAPDDYDGDLRPLGNAADIGADEYGAPPPSAVADLRVTQAITSVSALTATLRWTAPQGAVTTTLRASGVLITEATWASAAVLADAWPGNANVFTAAVSYQGGSVYFALKTQNAAGWSALSNNAFWPHFHVYLPVVLR